MKSNAILEGGASDYQHQLNIINEESTTYTEGAMKEVNAWRESVSEINKSIQNWADLETNAWEIIKKSIR